MLAYHYTEAGSTEQAIAAWQCTGQQAAERSAHVEAIAHFSQGLTLLQELPNTPERMQQELRLQTSLGPALMATKGFAAPEVERAYARAHELCQQMAETPQLFEVLRGLWRFYGVRAAFQTTQALGEQLLCLAQRSQDQALKQNAEALTLAHELPHPHTLAHALGFAATFYQFRREPQAVNEQVEAVMALSREQEFAQRSDVWWTAGWPRRNDRCH